MTISAIPSSAAAAGGSPKEAAFPDDVEFLVGCAGDWGIDREVTVRPAFDNAILAFFDALAQRILTRAEARQFPDVVAFARWCRKVSLESLRFQTPPGFVMLGRGIGFHVSPSNVPIMAAYNLALGLVAGNCTIVRLAFQRFPQIDYLCRELRACLSQLDHRALSGVMALIRYERSRADITQCLSARCDVRVIWGGDATVDEIRRMPLRPYAHEISFPDRYSVAVIDGAGWLAAGDKTGLMHGFYNDTFLSDQASCASPRMVLWLGEHAREARADFWPRLEALVGQRYRPALAQTVAKLGYVYGQLARHPGLRLVSSNPVVMRVLCDLPRPELLEDHPNGGVFMECEIAELGEVAPMLERRCQTVSYFGIAAEDVLAVITGAAALGGDRIVPMGRTLDFSAVWDGHDIVRALSRTIGFGTPPGARA